MINYFAGGSIGFGYEIMRNHLIAWIDKPEIKLRKKYLDIKCNVLFDSGAFSAFTTGKKININEYAEFIKNFSIKWKGKIKSLNFINLDIIGNADESWNNQEKMEKLNVNPLPVIHKGGFKNWHLEKACKEYKYFCVGGLVGKDRKKEIIPFLDYCYNYIMAYYKKTNIMPKIHLLGVADPKVLYRYPAFSCDSTAYMSVNKYGNSRFLKMNNIPKGGLKHKKKYKNENKYLYNKNDDRKLLERIMKYEIRQYHKQTLEITNFWKKKGFEFEI